MKEKFLAVTGDIIGSREVKKRDQLQKLLMDVSTEVNKKFKEFIVAKFSITLGDEVQGLIKRNSPIFKIIGYFEEKFYPYKIRFGIGEGTVSTSFYDTTTKMDGECFLNSRKALQQSKEEKRHIKIILDNKSIDPLIDIICFWIEKTKQEWTELQFKRFYLYKNLGSIEKVARKEKVTRQSIGKSLKRSKYDLVIKSEEIINNILST
ncbi:MAG: SatD family protein [Candidatus Omnitrophica bacterium]|nr:SatD family protein [Candidatus Omnitrophota bacterium]MCM8778013.1 SatD family protein [Candidatus Omnitrophota bacterium]